ncbi:MAG: DUF302 domain-containing protein [Pseudomonadota bacterium]|nr:MAG: DUF302 domain-containing protein [Pseudomonadota bacterium]
MKTLFISLVVATAVAACSPPAPKTPATGATADSNVIVRYSKEAKFENVRDDVENAIKNRGLVIDHTSHISNMLERTGKDLGTPTKIYNEGQAFSFCSAVVSRKTMEADAHNIAYCPYAVVVYATVAEPKNVYVAYTRAPATGSDANKAVIAEMNNLLDGIAKEGLNIK